MKLFLTGGTGVIGTRALPQLVAAGHEVTAVARGAQKADLVRRLGGIPVTVDLFDADAVKGAVAGHDGVIHLATNIPPLSKAGRAGAWATNARLRTEAATHLVDAALASGATLYVQESICFPYFDAGDRWIDETFPMDHENPLFASSGVAEAQAQRFADSSAGRGVVLRFAQFYADDSAHVSAMNAMVRKRINPFVGDPGSYASFIHAEDAGSAVVSALDAPTGIYNVVDDAPLTRAAAGRAVAQRLGRKPPRTLPGWLLRFVPSSKAVSRSQRVSHARFTEATGWHPGHPTIAEAWPVEVTA